MPSILWKKIHVQVLPTTLQQKNVVFCKNKEEQGLKFYIKRAYSTFPKIFHKKEG